MDTKQSLSCSLLELPDACLLTVLRCLAADDDEDPASLASAARAHSRLQQAAVAARSSISREFFKRQLESLLLYLDSHGQCIDSLALFGAEANHPPYSVDACATMRQLPTSLSRLTSLQLQRMNLQLQPGGGFQGVVRPGLPLKQLRLYHCRLLDGEEGLAAALSLLPELEHLSVYSLGYDRGGRPAPRFPPQVLPQLQRLTHLELCCKLRDDPDQEASALQPLQALSRLVDLRFGVTFDYDITAEILSGSPNLTRLDVPFADGFEAGALAGKTALQHLYVKALAPAVAVCPAGPSASDQGFRWARPSRFCGACTVQRTCWTAL